MNQVLLEIIRQKKTVLLTVFALFVINMLLMIAVTSYQEPALILQRAKWSELRSLVARSGHADAATLYRQGISDLEKLNKRIPPKREFARVLSDIIETAVDSGVVSGPITYKPVPIKDEALLSYQLSFSVSGDYASVKSCLADLLLNPELIVVDSVSFANSSLFDENVVMSLTVTVYLSGGV